MCNIDNPYEQNNENNAISGLLRESPAKCETSMASSQAASAAAFHDCKRFTWLHGLIA